MGYLSKTDSEREGTLLDISRAGITAIIYESPNRLLKTLSFIEDIFGANHEVYIGVELTKMHERHYRDTVSRVREAIENESEGSRFKGEVTLIIAPYTDGIGKESEKILKAGGFDIKRDSQVKIDLVSVASKINEQV